MQPSSPQGWQGTEPGIEATTLAGPLGVGVDVGVAVGVGEGVGVGVDVWVAVGVCVGVGVGVSVAVAVGVGTGVRVGIGVGVACGAQPPSRIATIKTPVALFMWSSFMVGVSYTAVSKQQARPPFAALSN